MSSQSLHCFLPCQLPNSHNFINCNTYHVSSFLPKLHKLQPISAKLTSTTTTHEEPSQDSPFLSKNHSPSYASLLQSCIDSHSFHLGKSIHAQMLAEGVQPDTYLQTKILMLYARAGEMADLLVARRMFDEMVERNSTAWNTMILAYSQAGDHEEVLELFLRMLDLGVVPDRFTFPSVVRACLVLEEKCGLDQVHGWVFKSGLNCNLVVGGALVDAYVRFGLMDEAVLVCEELDGENVVAWNAVIGGYARLLKWEEAWKAFRRMNDLGITSDHFTFATAIKVCGALGLLDRGTQVHCEVIKYGFETDVFIGNSLIDMYAKCEDSESSSQIFDEIGDRDQVSWNSIISGQAQLGNFTNALVLFKKMQMSGFQSDRFNLGSVLMACTGMRSLEMGREIHGYMTRNHLSTDMILGSALVDMYSKNGFLGEAYHIFNNLEHTNDVSWNALIAGYVQDGRLKEAIKAFREMRQTGIKPDQYTYTTLLTLCAEHGIQDLGEQIHAYLIRTVAKKHMALETELLRMYLRCGNFTYACEIFDKMPEKNAYTWNSWIVGCEQNDRPMMALKFLRQMQLTELRPDCFSLASALLACRSLSDRVKGKEIHGFMIRNEFEEESVLKCSLINMYAKCGAVDIAYQFYKQIRDKDIIVQNVMISTFVTYGRIEDARQIFNNMDERSTVSWNSILAGYARSGLSSETFGLFREMREQGDVDVNDSTLVTMSDLCADLPALEQGKQLHAYMIKLGLTHSSVVLDSVLVDMYAKGGVIEEARRHFDSMGERNVVSWNAMINGYAKHGFSGEVLHLFNQMKNDRISPNDVTFLSVLSACSHTGLIDEGLEIFISMIEEYRMHPKAEHYTCMVDLLGRAGLFDDVLEVMKQMPIEPEISTWGALLGACRVHKNVELGKYAAERLFKLDPENPGHYVLLSNIYAASGRLEEADEVRKLMKAKGLTKEPGISWIEIDNRINIFHASDQSHPLSKNIYATLKGLADRMKTLGYVPDINFVLRDVKGQKEDHLLHHSERLATALGLIQLPEEATVRVFKNLRICGDCHTAIKLISKITDRKIVVRDTNRFHHFENGFCSCGDYW